MGPVIMDEVVSKNTLSIIHLNAQGIRGKREELTLLLESYKSPDIVCITESWLVQDEPNFFQIPGYSIKSFFSRKIFQRGGVCIFVKDGKDFEAVDLSSFSTEMVCECVAIRNTKTNVTIVSAYTSPSANNETFDNFILSLEKIIYHITGGQVSSSTKYLFCGDFNVDFLVNSQKSMRLANLFESYGMLPKVNEPTRIGRTSRTLLDQIFTNDSGFSNLDVFESGFSDHLGQFFTLPLNFCSKNILKEQRFYTKNNTDTFTSLLKNESWASVRSCQGVNDKMECFLNIMMFYHNLAFPKEIIKLKSSRKCNWMTKGLLVSRKHKIWLNTIRKDDLSGFCDEYFHKYNKVYKQTIKKAKKLYNDSKIKSSDNVSKAAWRVVKDETCPTRSVEEWAIEDDQGNVQEDAGKVANIFNSYFINTPASLVREIPDISPGHSNGFYPLSHDELVLYPCDLNELLSVVNSRKNSFASGFDELPDKVMKGTLLFYGDILLEIINESLSSGVFPNILKLAKVRPLHKKGNKRKADNYRPVSNLSFFSKVIESVVKNRLVGFLEAFQIISPAQHGFVSGKSTTTALAEYIMEITRCLDSGESVIGLSIDQSKAFDCINHERLFERMHIYGIRGTSLAWFKSYLSDRSYYVELFCQESKQPVKSDIIKSNLGIGQGSILGPILFIIYINDLPTCFPMYKCVGFADDFNAILDAWTFDDLQSNADRTCNMIVQWFNANKLIVNSSKTQAVRFSLRNSAEQDNFPSMAMQGSDIHYVDQCKFLGVWVDEKLNWSYHINQLKKRLNSILYLLRALKGKVSKEVMLMVYYGKFQSLLSYGCVLWGQGVGWNDIFICQKKALRIINGREFDNTGRPITCRPIFKAYKVLTFPSLYIYECVKFILKNGSSFDIFENVHGHNTRNKAKFVLPPHRLSIFKKTVQYAGCSFMNHLPDYLEPFNGSSSGKLSRLKKFLLEKSFYSLNEFYGIV